MARDQELEEEEEVEDQEVLAEAPEETKTEVTSSQKLKRILRSKRKTSKRNKEIE